MRNTIWAMAYKAPPKLFTFFWLITIYRLGLKNFINTRALYER